MVGTLKFSQFMNGGDLSNSKTTVGFGGGSNIYYNNPWTFLPSGSTGSRPIPAADMYYRLRLNTTLQVYEYYDPTPALWVQLSGSGTGTVNPGVTNDIAFYPANGTTLSPITSSPDSVLITNALGVPDFNTTLPSGLNIPGATITASTAALLSGQVAAAPVNPPDLVNKLYADSLFGAGVTSITGTTNQVIASAATGPVTLSLPQDIATGSSPTFSALELSSSTQHAVMIGQSSISAMTSVLLGAGQVLVGTTALDPVAATIGSGQNITVTSASGSISVAFSGNLPVTNLNSGTGATNTTFWRGDGTWADPEGSGIVSSGLINQLAWYAANGTTVSGLATGNNGVLVTSGAGVPSISSTLPSGIAATNMNLTTPTLGVAAATSINFGGGALGTYIPSTAFTPTITFATPGDLSVVYATRGAFYSRIGNEVTVSFYIEFTPTYTTSSGALLIQTLPFTVNASNVAMGFCGAQTVTWPAGRTQVGCLAIAGTTNMDLISFGSGVAQSILGTANFITGILYRIFGSTTYLV